MPPTVQDEQPAITLDWLLEIHQTYCEWEKERYEHG